jgi:hypothetical protein
MTQDSPVRFTRESTVNELAVTRIGRGLRWVISKQAAKTAANPQEAQMLVELAGDMKLQDLVTMSEGKLPWPLADGVIDIANGKWGKVPSHVVALVRGMVSRPKRTQS